MKMREILALLAVVPLFLVMGMSFVGVPWPTELHEVPVYDGTGGHGIANSLFETFAVTLVLIALVLAAAMIGGIYLAKGDEAGKVGP